jgi:hypothetical protein
MFQARVTAVVQRLAPGVPFSEGLKLSAKMMTAISPEAIGRMMSGKEATQLIRRRRSESGADHFAEQPDREAIGLQTPLGCSRPGGRPAS